MLTSLNIMLTGLKKKEQALLEILAISENQKTVIESELPLDESRELVFQMNSGKQAAIQIVKDCDNMFEAMLKEMGQELEREQDNYKPQVKVMQEHIKRIMDIDVKIRVTEQENNRLLDGKRELFAPPNIGLKPRMSVMKDTKTVIDAYKESSKNFKG